MRLEIQFHVPFSSYHLDGMYTLVPHDVTGTTMGAQGTASTVRLGEGNEKQNEKNVAAAMMAMQLKCTVFIDATTKLFAVLKLTRSFQHRGTYDDLNQSEQRVLHDCIPPHPSRSFTGEEKSRL